MFVRATCIFSQVFALMGSNNTWYFEFCGHAWTSTLVKVMFDWYEVSSGIITLIINKGVVNHRGQMSKLVTTMFVQSTSNILICMRAGQWCFFVNMFLVCLYLSPKLDIRMFTWSSSSLLCRYIFLVLRDHGWYVVYI